MWDHFAYGLRVRAGLLRKDGYQADDPTVKAHRYARAEAFEEIAENIVALNEGRDT